MPRPKKAPNGLTHPVMVRLDSQTLAAVQAWCESLNAQNPGLRFSVADALRSLVARALASPEVAGRRG